MKHFFITIVAVCLLVSCTEKPPFNSDMFNIIFAGNVIDATYVEHTNPGGESGAEVNDWTEKTVTVIDSVGTTKKFNVVNLYDYADAIYDMELKKNALRNNTERTWFQNLFYSPKKEYNDYLSRKKRTQIMRGWAVFIYNDSGYYFISTKELNDDEKRAVYDMLY